MIGFKLNRSLELGAFHALYRSDGIWYHNLKQFPGVLFDQNGYIIFNSREEYEANPSLKIRKDLNVVGGISSLQSYQLFSDAELNIAKAILNQTTIISSEEIVRQVREIELRLRNRKLIDL